MQEVFPRKSLKFSNKIFELVVPTLQLFMPVSEIEETLSRIMGGNGGSRHMNKNKLDVKIWSSNSKGFHLRLVHEELTQMHTLYRKVQDIQWDFDTIEINRVLNV